jgi:chemotaxis protein CheD
VPLTPTATEHLARMGEIVSSANAGDVLACVGLGSCIGLALIDRRAGVAGLAHVMLPAAPPEADRAGKFADLAVPTLVEEIERLGAARHRLDAVLVGGASMFSFGSGGTSQEIGRRNEEAVRAALAASRIPVRAAETGGDRGRTMRVHVGTARVTSREAAGAEIELYGDAPIDLRRAA